ncbi:MAG TPA: phosphatidate cytidylyltransferase [Syntrophales bacterium]|nr:phosphatidate cytidylyltransferase [Syntrophales bacterium]HOL59091.1 phosphatidate cytidylyltransferase [Syntrophales bacterium]HPO35400.1 phosphatidate cytidylyltransferase [Syntrophales bacterium]
MNAHAKRWLTAAVLLPIIVGIICFAPPWVFAILIILVIAIGVGEYNTLTLGAGFSWRKFLSIGGAILCPVVFYFGEARSVVAFLALFLMVMFFLELLRVKGETIDLIPLFKMAFGFFYLPFTLSHFIWLHQGPKGLWWIFFVLVLAFSGDTAAYYVGRTMGRRPLIPAVSAGKTVEGTLALVVFSTLCCYVYGKLFFSSSPGYHFAILGLVGSILGQLGDLCESALKRMAGVKDSSNLLPGHGGLLDRLDCLVFVAPFVYHYRQAFLP